MRHLYTLFLSCMLHGQTDVLAKLETTADGPAIVLSRAEGGLRFEVRADGRLHGVTLSLEQAEEMRRLAAKLQEDVERVRTRNFAGFLGLCEYRDHQYPVRFDYCLAGTCVRSLRVFGPGPSVREFADRSPGDLAEKLAVALRAISASRPGADRE